MNYLNNALCPLLWKIKRYCVFCKTQFIYLVFQCKCCKIVESAGGEIPSSMPDLSALYKLHLECGKLINLCDWLEVNFGLFLLINKQKIQSTMNF